LLAPEQQGDNIHGTRKHLRCLSREGNVTDIKVTSGNPLLVEAARSAVSQCKYSPTLLNGKPIPVMTTIMMSFSFTAGGETAISVED
jgi:hypothetical protein